MSMMRNGLGLMASSLIACMCGCRHVESNAALESASTPGRTRIPFLTEEKPWIGEELGSLHGIQAGALPLYRQAAEVYSSAEFARAADVMAAKIPRPVSLLAGNRGWKLEATGRL